jgi:flagellar protein FlgJ
MTPISPSPLPAATDATQPGTTLPSEREKALKAARDFEAIFVRQLLKPLEKSHAMSKQGSSGGDIYGSMYVNSLADAVTSGGGLGMSEMIADALAPALRAPTKPVP